jgi:enoyl-CoA hydratase/3-hydroxyacyl-CoA dehydrogenase
MGRIKSNLASRVKKGRMSQAAADAAMAKVKGTLDYADFGECWGFGF